jgi:mannose-6-phosphate isomerase-like protein (cupin superfamily)
MKSRDTSTIHADFAPICATRSAQAALMELKPGGESDDDVSNEHPHSEQWVFVLAGSGRATVVNKKQSPRRVKLCPGLLLVIEKGERHQIRNTGRGKLRILNMYCPPAYDSKGNLR